jgi:ATP-dependent RNA helicase RhlE
MSFSKFDLAPNFQSVFETLQYENPTPIQSLVIPAFSAKNDLLGIAPTGSGKTASYVLPILSQLSNQPLTKNRQPAVLVLVPTRELALQVTDVFKTFAHALSTPPKVLAVYGGVSINPQMKALMGVSVLVATPGRLLELVENNALQLSKVSFFVLDEADKLLNLGFQEEMQKIVHLLPEKRKNCLFSATLSDKINEVSLFLLKNPVVLKVEKETDDLDQIEQSAYFIPEEKRGPLLRYLIKSQNLHQVLVFVSSTFKADAVVEKLRKNKLDAVAIHSKKSQDARIRSLRNFKEGKTRILVATDLIARGIDIDYLPVVVNYELPRSPKDYIHRIGRTGRASATGVAYTFVAPTDEHHFKIIQKKIGKQITRVAIELTDLNGY